MKEVMCVGVRRRSVTESSRPGSVSDIYIYIYIYIYILMMWG